MFTDVYGAKTHGGTRAAKGTGAMTRILVVSDTHGDEQALRQALEEQPTARMIFHLGDGAREAEAVAAGYPDRTFFLVRGTETGDRRGSFRRRGWKLSPAIGYSTPTVIATT